MKAEQLLKDARKELRAGTNHLSWAGDVPGEAVEMLEAALGRTPYLDDEIPAPAARKFRQMVARRAKGEPLPYILGFKEFMGMNLSVKRGAFVPRTSSESLAKEAIRRARPRQRPLVADIACGIGPVAMGVAKSLPRAKVYGCDLSAPALAQGRANAAALKIRNVEFLHGSLFAPLPKSARGALDVVTSHPPYIAKHELPELPTELLKFEPRMSLTDGRSGDGLDLVRTIVAEAREWLRPGGWLLIEMGPEVSRPVRAMFTRNGYRDVRSRPDHLDVTRIISGRV
jgi:release factor glutamine methyltransferase